MDQVFQGLNRAPGVDKGIDEMDLNSQHCPLLT